MYDIKSLSWKLVLQGVFALGLAGVIDSSVPPVSAQVETGPNYCINNAPIKEKVDYILEANVSNVTSEAFKEEKDSSYKVRNKADFTIKSIKRAKQGLTIPKVGDEFHLRYEGGKAQGQSQYVDKAPSFKQGQDVTLYLKGDYPNLSLLCGSDGVVNTFVQDFFRNASKQIKSKK